MKGSSMALDVISSCSFDQRSRFLKIPVYQGWFLKRKQKVPSQKEGINIKQGITKYGIKQCIHHSFL